MSTEAANPIVSLPPTAPTPEPLPVAQVVITCLTCHENIPDGEMKLTCTNKRCAKFTCIDCAKKMIEVMFAQATLQCALKCGGCRHSFDQIEMDQVISKLNRYEQYIACVLPLHWSEDCLNINERLIQCPFCPYLEIHTTDACEINFFKCQHPACGQRSCLICLHAITDDNDESKHRLQCVEMRHYKEMIDKAIELGSKQRCPHCDLSGIKDDNCTHMVCQRCSMVWCYLCGMKEEDCLVDDDAEPSLSAHNQDWEHHKGRCPMSLTSIQELDDRWPSYDQDCVEYFHRYRTLCELFAVLKSVGEDKLEEINDAYGLIDSTGFSIDEILDFENEVLIKYPDDEE